MRSEVTNAELCRELARFRWVDEGGSNVERKRRARNRAKRERKARRAA